MISILDFTRVGRFHWCVGIVEGPLDLFVLMKKLCLGYCTETYLYLYVCVCVCVCVCVHVRSSDGSYVGSKNNEIPGM